MAYKKRYDGRKANEHRKIEAKAGVIRKANGSAFFKIGNTWAYAAVYGPKNLHPKFLQDHKKGVLRCFYNMMPFSGVGDRVRPGPNRRAKEISMVVTKALLPVVDLSDCPNSSVDVFIDLPQTDAGSRCAAICAASIALADAGIKMKDMVSAIAVGRVDDALVVDLDYKEEAYPDGPVADIPVAFVPSTGELSLLQMDGHISKDQLIEVLGKAKEACSEIAEIQRAAVRERFLKVVEEVKGEQNE